MEDVFKAIWHWITSLSDLTKLAVIITPVSSLILYLVKQAKLPKLVFDGVWKQNDEVTLTGVRYFLKVKQVKGDGRPQGIDGFVGIKDKLEPKPSSWLSSRIDSNFKFYNYLVLFKILNYNGNDVITFPGSKKQPTELSEDDYYNRYETDSIVVKIEVPPPNCETILNLQG